MKKHTLNLNEIALNTRRSWGTCNPATKVIQSKKGYNRKDNSWKKDLD